MISINFTEEMTEATTNNLYQWDTYQTLHITGIDFGSVTPKVHFCNKRSTEALVVTGTLNSDGSVDVSVPNTLLKEKYNIVGYIYKNTGLTGQTIKSIVIPIVARLKPSEYSQPSDEDIAEIEAIELEAKAIIDGLTASEYSATESYLRPNIVYYQGNAYMCVSGAEITGIEPTNTTNWKLLCKGSYITNVTTNDDGCFVFTFSNGEVFTVALGTMEVQTVSVPALSLTDAEVTTLKKLKLSSSTTVSKGGLYALYAWNETTTEYCSEVMFISNIQNYVYGSMFTYSSTTKTFSCTKSGYSITRTILIMEV